MNGDGVSACLENTSGDWIFQGTPQQGKEVGGIIGPSNQKVGCQELLDLGSAIIKNYLTLRSAFLCWLYSKDFHRGC